jgi:DNA polymerase III alpha subunit
MVDGLSDADVAAFFRRSAADGDVLIVMNLRDHAAQWDLSSVAAGYELKAVLGTSEERIAYEWRIICETGYAEYYLIVWDFIRYAKSVGIPVGPGRGSGAGSLIAYLIGITDVDSIRYSLMFERFLNPERVSMPDFDIDFCDTRRGEVIEYVKQRYGEDHVAQIVTFGTLAARAAVRDVGRALDMPYADVDRVAKAIPRVLDMTLAEAKKHVAWYIKDIRGAAAARDAVMCAETPTAMAAVLDELKNNIE